ncbi:MAG: hypothetical protein GY822_25790 [Deltaproteobacteria bacterium]|nr:hypothetical protein [Deltaproteobacteria bacterium]
MLQHPLGSPRHWARDFALVGAASSLLTPLMASMGYMPVGYLALSCLGGGLFGALTGWLSAKLLAGSLVKVPFFALLLCGPLVGFAWGASTGLFSSMGLPSTGMLRWSEMWFVSVLAAGFAGALQFAWFWLPYTLRKSRGKSSAFLVGFAILMPIFAFTSVAIVSCFVPLV